MHYIFAAKDGELRLMYVVDILQDYHLAHEHTMAMRKLLNHKHLYQSPRKPNNLSKDPFYK